ncbi:hypothetical protein [Halanaerobacter jeridensis]|uniref:Uncharacterized membrane protein YgaE (UPF0421/DUF939 family) n=1 Tax=Halanaerobacter jeridensis TaxID=706427 RepID=A0A938XU33_9FIRM|nr:hypothetical protein [Halanaerobacter jeridensis]MBM7557545.1 uncharacterized membrane protein YgaE (UPF0421/DUF939 family) [Halanaerobacter jeridensis]
MRMRNMLADALLPSVNTSSFALGVGATLLTLRYMPELDIEEMSEDIKERAQNMKEKMAQMDLETTAYDDIDTTNEQNFQSPDDVAVIGSSPSVEKLQSQISKLQVQLNQLKNNI